MTGWYELLRYVVFAVAAFFTLVGVASWLVRSRRVSPFSPLARALTRFSEPWVTPMERRLVRAGANPLHAPWWIMGSAVVGGLLVLLVARWVAEFWWTTAFALRSGPIGVLRFALNLAYRILVLAIIVRVLGAWFGVSGYRRWMRPFYVLTEWLIAPLRRVVPPLGMVDITPLVAWFLLWIAHGFLMGLLR